MGELGEGSSNAAQGAPGEDSIERSDGRGQNSGFLGRLIGALSPSDQGEPIPEPVAQGAAGAPSAVTVPGMVNLRRLRVEDVMIPKAEIVSVPVEITKKELVEKFRESGLTRLPVFKNTLDHPIGLVHMKDFALTHGFNGGSTRFALRKLVRLLLYAPPSMPIGVLMQKMQAERIHMALVIDEYGGVDGLVTLEDLVEQVLGEIEDEHDLEEGALWVKEEPGSYLAEARAPLEEFEAEIGFGLRGIDPDDEEIDTLGGLVFLIAGHVPARGEVVTHPAGPEFEVVDADPRRIKRLKVRFAMSEADG